jgi:hypothetical protein
MSAESKKDPLAAAAAAGITIFPKPTLTVAGWQVERYAIQTHFVMPDEDLSQVVRRYVLPIYSPGDVLSIGEKVASLTAGEYIREEDLRMSGAARFLAKFAARGGSTGYAGVGVNEPRKMQLAIDLAGLPRVILASLCSGFGKLIGKRGLFYQVVGHDVARIDGFYNGSSFEFYRRTAVLPPRNPDEICQRVQDETGVAAIITDANDADAVITAKSSAVPFSLSELRSFMIDNPSGQRDEKTSLVLIRISQKH